MDRNLVWLFVAFAIAWTIVFLYLFHISSREKALRRRVAAIEDLISGRQGDPAGATDRFQNP